MNLAELIALLASTGGKLEITFNVKDQKGELNPNVVEKVQTPTPAPVSNQEVQVAPAQSIETVKSETAPIPTASLEEETGMSYDQVLAWSVDGDPVPGTNDQSISDTTIQDPKINGVNPV